jgi:hypothetical protein
MTDVGKKLRKPSPRYIQKAHSANMYTLGSWRASFNPRHGLLGSTKINIQAAPEGFRIRIVHTILVCLACVFSLSYTG